MVRAVLPTPPSPSTTSLYSVILPAIVRDWVQRAGGRKGEDAAEGRARGVRGSYLGRARPGRRGASCKLRATSLQKPSRAGSSAADQRARLTLQAGRAGQRPEGRVQGVAARPKRALGVVVPNVSDAAGTAAQVRVAGRCRRFRIDRGAENTALHKPTFEAGAWPVQCSGGVAGASGRRDGGGRLHRAQREDGGRRARAGRGQRGAVRCGAGSGEEFE
jgi:hypothetical protein